MMPRALRRMCCLIGSLCLSVPAAAQCAGWLEGDGYLGTEHQVYFAVPWDPDGAGPREELLVLGGHFRAVGAEPFKFLAAFDGEVFIPLGDNFFGGVGTVHVHEGDLYVGGTRLDEFGVYHPGVFRWDTADLAWERVGEAPYNGFVFSLGTWNGQLVAGGTFEGFGDTAMNRVAYWDGAAWQPLGSGLGGTDPQLSSPFDSVSAVVEYQGELYAGGYFLGTGDNLLVNHLARWDGSQWVGVNGGASDEIFSLAADSNGLYVGGRFTSIGGQAVPNAARWNGSTFSSLGSGVATWVYDLRARGNGEVVVGGLFSQAGGQTARRIATWNQNTQAWTTYGSGFNNDVLATADYQGSLYAAGRFEQTGVPGTLGNRPLSNIARWDGANWRPIVEHGFSGTVSNQCITYALGTYNGNLVAGGRFWFFENTQGNGVAVRVNGQWQSLGNGLSNGVATPLVHAVAEWNGSLYVGGTFVKPWGAASNSIGAARWDGAQWHGMGSGGNHNSLAVAVYNNSVYYGGLFSSMSGRPNTAGIARWDGSQWHSVGGGIPGGQIWAMTQLGSDLIVAGRFNAAGGVPAKNIARWDGAQWHAMGDGIGQDPNVIIKALAVYNGQLYAGGEYIDFSGATPLSGVVRWNGASWEEVGGTVTPHATVLAMGVHGGKLFVGGTLRDTTLGGVPVNNIARFDGTSWDNMRGGRGEYVESLLSLGGELYVGSAPYTNQGSDSVSPCLSRWSEGAGVLIAYHPVDTASTPGGSVEFRVRATGATEGVTYQWFHDGQPVVDGQGGAAVGGGVVSGVLTDRLVIQGVQCVDGGTYHAVVSSENCNAAVSGTAALVVSGCSAPCPDVDFNQDGGLDVADIAAFFDAFTGADPAPLLDPDVNQDGGIDVADIDAFFTAFAGGPC